MTRYVALARRPKAGDWDDDQVVVTSITVHESDHSPVETGLLDAHGTPLYRVNERPKMGC